VVHNVVAVVVDGVDVGVVSSSLCKQKGDND